MTANKNLEQFKKKITKAREMGLLETAFDNVQSGKSHERNIKHNRDRLNEIKQSTDKLRNDLNDYIVRNGYGDIFSK